VRGAELVIHNAEFDVGFLNAELARAREAPAEDERALIVDCIAGVCTITDSLALARRLHPGQKSDLDSLCRRYGVDNSQRTYHGALLDAEILADVYLAMTGGQAALFEDTRAGPGAGPGFGAFEIVRIADKPPLAVIEASAEELAAHRAWLEELDKKSGGKCVWRLLEPAPPSGQLEASN